jgi:prepilin-type N-terminal cleavage/methylation domain-containing protein
MSSKGFTLLESLISLGILSITLVSMLPAFQTFMDANTLSEERSNALAAAQEVMEALRHEDPSSLPTSGSSAIQAVQVGSQEYEVVTHYCLNGTYCGSDIRHITVEVSFAGKSVYTIETVFTRLR